MCLRLGTDLLFWPHGVRAGAWPGKVISLRGGGNWGALETRDQLSLATKNVPVFCLLLESLPDSHPEGGSTGRDIFEVRRAIWGQFEGPSMLSGDRRLMQEVSRGCPVSQWILDGKRVEKPGTDRTGSEQGGGCESDPDVV